MRLRSRSLNSVTRLPINPAGPINRRIIVSKHTEKDVSNKAFQEHRVVAEIHGLRQDYSGRQALRGGANPVLIPLPVPQGTKKGLYLLVQKRRGPDECVNAITGERT